MKAYLIKDNRIIDVDKVYIDDNLTCIYKHNDTEKLYTYNDIIPFNYGVITDKYNELNVLHFQGSSLTEHKRAVELLKPIKITSIPKDLSIITSYTNENLCIVKQQCENVINSCPNISPENWDMRCKIINIVTTLENIKTKYTLIVDGYDVIITTLDNLIDKFNKCGYKILYNATANNYPMDIIDKIHDRDWLGTYCYFNAGCCIGYTDALLKFYKEALEIIDIPNVDKSEQYILRHIFKKYVETVGNTFIMFDYNRQMFQTMGRTVFIKLEMFDNKYLTMPYTNDEKNKVIV